MLLKNIGFLLLVISIPVFLGVNAVQANKCGEIRKDIKALERFQENSVKNGRILAAEIADLLAVERLENEAKNNMVLRKMRPEEIHLIIVGGKGLDL